MVVNVITSRRRRRRFGVLPRGTYDEIFRAIPQPGTQDHLRWCDEYFWGRYAQVVQPRQVVVYVSESEGDDGNLGYESTPIRTIDRILEVIGNPTLLGRPNIGTSPTQINSFTCSLEFRFLRGNTWYDAEGVQISSGVVRDVSFTDYGDSSDPRPRIHCWSAVSGTWANTSGNVWKLTGVSAAPGWIIEGTTDASLLNPLTLTNSGSIASTSRSWYYNSGTQEVYINLGGSNPNAATLQWVIGTNNNIDGIYAENVGDAYIRGLRIEGYGARAYGSSTGYGIETRQAGDYGAVVEDCECYYNGNHSIGHISDPSGGFCLHYRNIVGHCGIVSGGGYNSLVGYSSQGGLEYYAKANTCRFGGVPNTNITPIPRNPGGFDPSNTNYGHTGGDAYDNTLFIVDDQRVENNTGSFPRANHMCFSPAFDDKQMVGDDTDLSTIRAFFIRSRQTGGNATNLRAMPKVAWVQVEWLAVAGLGSPYSSTVFSAINSDTGVGGWWFECIMQIATVSTGRNMLMWINAGGGDVCAPKIYSSHFEMDASSIGNSWTFATSSISANMTLVNTIVSDIATGASHTFNLNVPEANITTSAFYGTPLSQWSSQIDGGTGSVSLASKPVVAAAPVAALLAATTDPGGVVIDYDARGNEWAGAIGPYQGA